jgi:hypothetical protein
VHPELSCNAAYLMTIIFVRKLPHFPTRYTSASAITCALNQALNIVLMTKLPWQVQHVHP